ncbi:MAG TPA: DUF1801 domain-containing protein [Candidatus Acidoferrum sp.]|nr:DUF1801 domain-containing protein [Candidatus Acidoferrum sp.]
MPEPKTTRTEKSAAGFFAAIKNEEVRKDCKIISAIMQATTKEKPVMWGSSIVGFGHHRSVYASGKESNWMLIAFSPRKQNIVLYLMIGYNRQEHLLAKLGKHTTGKGCLYLKRLSDIHIPTLKKLVASAVKERKKTDLSSKGNSLR